MTEKKPYPTPKGADLIAFTEYPTPNWVVKDLLPEGLTILAGKSKAGKSWLALQVALCLGWPEQELFYRKTADGPSLYLDLEMSERLSKDRIVAMCKPQEMYAPADMMISHEWPRFGEAGGMASLNAYLNDHPDTKMIVIDTLAKVWMDKARGSVYHAEYQQLGELARVARNHRTSILALHHTSKDDKSDPLDRISGSTAMQGAVDAAWVIERERGKETAQLHITGREVLDRTLHLRWNKDDCWWSLEEDDDIVVV